MKVKEGDGAMPCEAGEPITCGSTVRLEHVVTSKNLHSHSFKSPLSRGQEVQRNNLSAAVHTYFREVP